MKQFINKIILITGATGSFGNKFIEMILKSKIEFKKIIIYSRDEFNQYNIRNNFNNWSYLITLYISYFLLIINYNKISFNK